MKKCTKTIIVLGVLLLMTNLISGFAATTKPEDLLQGVEHFNQSTIKFHGNKIIYFDPYKLATEPHDADLIFITHTHSDHLSPADLAKAMKPDTTVIVTADGEAKVKAAGITKIITVVPDKDYQVDGVAFKTVPAYNTNKNFHLKEKGWVGYIIQLNNTRYYLAGDTDVIPEMNTFKADVAFLPVGGTYTTTATEAAQAANIIKPAVAVPIHFGSVVGTIEDAKQFIKLLNPEIKGVILQKN
ncbi:MAG TPA: MBL fold metallo-hydrolase [Bacillota bacterium]|nr:MBL fold metallo-hydrolase [Bacillota bacterium]